MTRTPRLLAAMAAAGFAVSSAPAEARPLHPPLARVCHQVRPGTFILMTVPRSVVPRMLFRGDVLPGAWVPDADGDGFGAAGASPVACPAPGLVVDTSDCDDADPAVFPGATEALDGVDQDCDGWTDEGLACPCFDEADLDALMEGGETYAMSWRRRVDNRGSVLSLRSYTWTYDEADGQWKSPYVGADVYRDLGALGTPWCEVWTGTWLAAPDHAWADDHDGEPRDLAPEDVGVCTAVLEAWIEKNGVPWTAW